MELWRVGVEERFLCHKATKHTMVHKGYPDYGGKEKREVAKTQRMDHDLMLVIILFDSIPEGFFLS